MSVKTQLCLARAETQFFVWFGAFGLTFVWAFGASRMLHDFTFFSGELAEAEGVVSAAGDTRVNLNSDSVYAYHFNYAVGGRARAGVTEGFKGCHEVGDPVTVEYAVEDPARARIRGTSTSRVFPVLFALVFPLIATVLMVPIVRQGWRACRLLRDGNWAAGVLAPTEQSDGDGGNGGEDGDGDDGDDEDAVVASPFKFTTKDGKTYVVTDPMSGRPPSNGRGGGRSGGDDGSAVSESGDYPVCVLYDPRNPGDAVALELLPGRPGVDGGGDIEGNFTRLVPWLLLPGAAVVGHVGWALHVVELL